MNSQDVAHPELLLEQLRFRVRELARVDVANLTPDGTAQYASDVREFLETVHEHLAELSRPTVQVVTPRALQAELYAAGVARGARIALLAIIAAAGFIVTVRQIQEQLATVRASRSPRAIDDGAKTGKRRGRRRKTDAAIDAEPVTGDGVYQ